MEGETEWEEGLEVCLSQRWGTGWALADAQFVCGDLGYKINSDGS